MSQNYHSHFKLRVGTEIYKVLLLRSLIPSFEAALKYSQSFVLYLFPSVRELFLV